MPHDVKGRVIEVGDTVMVPCRVKKVQIGEDYCNVDLETVHAMYPGNDRSFISLNAKQVEIVAKGAGYAAPAAG